MKKARVEGEGNGSSSSNHDCAHWNVLAESTNDLLTNYVVSAILPYVHRPQLELELRLGRILEKNPPTNARRVNIPVRTPAVVSAPHRMESEVAEADFHRLIERLQQLTEGGAKKRKEASAAAVGETEQREGADGEGEVDLPVVLTRDDTVWSDVIFSDGVRRSTRKNGPAGAEDTEPATIRKEKLVTIDIYCPGLKYDMRVCLSSELKCEARSTTVQLQREKERTTFRPINGGPLMMEGTVVQQGGKKVYEFEIEAALHGEQKKSSATEAGAEGAGKEGTTGPSRGYLQDVVRCLLAEAANANAGLK